MLVLVTGHEGSIESVMTRLLRPGGHEHTVAATWHVEDISGRWLEALATVFMWRPRQSADEEWTSRGSEGSPSVRARVHGRSQYSESSRVSVRLDHPRCSHELRVHPAPPHTATVGEWPSGKRPHLDN
jgi:hypothetical protein